MKSILIISGTFYPLNSPRSFRTTELAREFVRVGHEVTVLLPENRKSEAMCQFAKDNNISLQFFGPLSWKVFAGSKIFGEFGRKADRILNLFFQYPAMEIYYKLTKYLGEIKIKYDLVLSIAVPHQIHWAVAKIQSQSKIGKYWIADCGDPFMGNRLDTMRVPFYFNYFENKFLKHADFVTVPITGAIPAYNKKFVNKIKVIPQGFIFDGNTVDNYKKGAKLRFAYAGGVSLKGARSPYKLIEYLLSLPSDFEFHVYSNKASSLKILAEKSNGRLILHESIPRNQLIKKLGTMDFLINFENGLSTASPSKLIDYSLAKRPILSINPFAPKIAYIDEFLSGDYRNRYILENLDQYNIIHVAQDFLKLTR